MDQIVLFFLHRFSPETAHRIGIFLMRVYQFFWVRIRRGKIRPGTGPALLPSRPSLHFANRLGLAAGFDKNAEVYPALARFGFGFLEVGTVTPLPQAGNPKPRIWRVPPQSLINSLGFNNCGLVHFKKNLARYRRAVACPIFANVGKGKETPAESAIEDYAQGFAALEPLVDGFVVNISSPNTPGLRDLQSVKFLAALERVLPAHCPVFVKLAPDLSNETLSEMVDAIGQSAIITGVVLTNTSIQMAGRFPGLKGGLSGPPLLERSLECIALARDRLGSRKIIIGVGGVSDPSDYREMRAAGADLVEVYTAFIYKGPPWLKEMARSAD